MRSVLICWGLPGTVPRSEYAWRCGSGAPSKVIRPAKYYGSIHGQAHCRALRLFWGRGLSLVSACLLQALSWRIHLGCDESIRLSPYRALYDIPARAIDRSKLESSVNLMGESGRGFSAEQGARVLAEQATRTDLAAAPALPAETRLWAAVQEVSGAPWGGRVFDVDSILKVLAAGKRAIERTARLCVIGSGRRTSALIPHYLCLVGSNRATDWRSVAAGCDGLADHARGPVRVFGNGGARRHPQGSSTGIPNGMSPNPN